MNPETIHSTAETRDTQNSELANDYLKNIYDPAARASFKKEHQELKIPIEAYESVSNALSSIPMPEGKSERVLRSLAEHYADRIKEQDADPLGPKDSVYAAVFFDNERIKRNQESAEYFHANIDTLIFRTNQLPPESHKELIGAYYQYLQAANKYVNDPDALEKIKEKMTEQIRTNSPESFSTPTNHQEKEPELAR